MKTQTLKDFYQHKVDAPSVVINDGVGHFNVFRLEDCLPNETPTISYSRRDFYKICLIRGTNRYHYADKSIEVQVQH